MNLASILNIKNIVYYGQLYESKISPFDAIWNALFGPTPPSVNATHKPPPLVGVAGYESYIISPLLSVDNVLPGAAKYPLIVRYVEHAVEASDASTDVLPNKVRGCCVAVGVLVSVGVVVGVLVAVIVGVTVGVLVAVIVGVGVFVEFCVGVCVGVDVLVLVKVGVGVGVDVAALVDVGVGVGTSAQTTSTLKQIVS